MAKLRVRLTDHGVDRSKDRLGIPRKAAKAFSKRVWGEGVRSIEATGSLKRYMDDVENRHDAAVTSIRIYGRHVYVFKNKALVTVLHLPKELYGAVDKLVARWR